MTDVSDRYARLSTAFRDKVAAVPDDRWASPSPCAEWTARDVVRHAVDTQGLMLGFVGRELGELPSVDDDPLGAWEGARAVVQAGLDDPAVADAEFDGLFGRTTFAQAVDRFLCNDLVVHGWDLAHATGLDERIDPAELSGLQATFEAFGEGLRSPGAFKEAVDPPAGADEQTKVLAFLGRKAW